MATQEFTTPKLFQEAHNVSLGPCELQIPAGGEILHYFECAEIITSMVEHLSQSVGMLDDNNTGDFDLRNFAWTVNNLSGAAVGIVQAVKAEMLADGEISAHGGAK